MLNGGILMPEVQFTVREEVTQWWRVQMDIPQDVIDEGDDAMRDYVENSSEGRDYLSIEEAEVTEAMMEPDEFEVVE
jgi:histidinol dehydrogenase